jgi:hypothetical protein
MSMRAHPLSLLLLALLAGCGARQGNGDSWFPLTPGASWNYAVETESDGATQKSEQTITVLDERSYDGKPLFIRRSETADNIGVEYWLRETPEGIVRIAQRIDLQEQAVLDEKPRTVLKLPLAQGATWRVPTVAYTMMKKLEFPRELKYGRGMLMSYTVEAMDEAVTVPAGSYAHCARIVGRAEMTLFVDPVRGFSKIPVTSTEWYCRGVGLVKLERSEEVSGAFYSGGKVSMVLTDFSPR